MGYTDGEALLLTRVQALTNFDSTNTRRANWLVLNKGKKAHYAILRPGEFTTEWITVTRYIANWATVIEIWQRYAAKAPGTAYTDLLSRVKEVIDGLVQYPHLGGSISDSTIESGGEVMEMWVKAGVPQWLKWEITVRWKEENSVSLQE